MQSLTSMRSAIPGAGSHVTSRRILGPEIQRATYVTEEYIRNSTGAMTLTSER